MVNKLEKPQLEEQYWDNERNSRQSHVERRELTKTELPNGNPQLALNSP